MKRIVYIFLAMFLGANVLDAQTLDSLTKAGLGSRIEEYFGAIAGEGLDVQKAEADFMIELSPDSLIRQFTAEKIYEHYVNSPVMGSENVAVYVFDKWFRDGKLKMDSDMDFLNARIYADFNRQSLLGESAPELVMESFEGETVRLFQDEEGPGKYRVLFFYDAGCAKCKVESILLRNLMMTEDYPVEFYAVYAGDDREVWGKYVAERFDKENSRIPVVHLWDPLMDSDFQRKYGVIQTPRMFLINPKGIIIGRGLDTKSLSLMLERLFSDTQLEYGGKESADLFGGIFDETASEDDVMRIADYIEESTLGQDNIVMFRQLTGDFLYWLSNRREAAFKEGADYLIDNKILSRPDIWKSQDDSLKVIGLAEFMDGLLEKSRPGTKISGVKIPMERVKAGKSKSIECRLDRIGGRKNIIIFYTEGCSNCEAEKAAARNLASRERGVRVSMVNVDEILAQRPSLADQLFEAFDLSSLPFIIETDRKGIILNRYITLQKVRNICKEITMVGEYNTGQSLVTG